ncbi:MAG: ATP-binding protein [Bryobacteraceae bacterium]
MAEAREKIPGDVVNRATADLPDNQRSAIRRFHAYYLENDLSLNEAGKLIDLSGSTLGLAFRGKYEARLDNLVGEIERFFELFDKRNQGRKLQFIPTRLTERIWRVCESALEFQRAAFIFGESQIGKTEALLEYARTHNHGSTIYVSVPTGGHISHFLCRLAETLRISARMRPAELRQRIIGAFDSRMLLIVDEAHQCIIEHAHSTCRLQTIEFIREIFDQTHCGLVICATKVFQEEMECGALEKLLRQMRRRRLCALNLPDRPTQQDLNTFSAANGLPPSSGEARKLEASMVDSEALGMWLTLLRMASKLATQRKQPLTWAHVLTAHNGLQQLETGSN